MGIILAILLFSLIIIIHELGHFTLAKLNGIRVDEFSLGMGPTLFGKEFKGTKFSLKLLPLGGACMMGEDDADDTSDERITGIHRKCFLCQQDLTSALLSDFL